MGHAPENTLAAFRKALELGAPAIELDVYALDGELLVFHDDRLERTTSGRGRLQDQPLSYLRSLDAGGGEPIPTLAEVCDLIAGQALLNIELKGADTAEPVTRFLQSLLSQPDCRWYKAQFLLSSFNHRELQQAARYDPELALGALCYGLPLDDARFASDLGAVSVNPGHDMLDRRFVEDAHARGLLVCAYTVNEPDDLARMAALGVDGVFSNYPERVLNTFTQPDTRQGWRGLTGSVPQPDGIGPALYYS